MKTGIFLKFYEIHCRARYPCRGHTADNRAVPVPSGRTAGQRISGPRIFHAVLLWSFRERPVRTIKKYIFSTFSDIITCMADRCEAAETALRHIWNALLTEMGKLDMIWVIDCLMKGERFR